MARQVTVEILGNAKEFTKATQEATASGNSFGTSMQKIGIAAGLAIAGTAVAVGIASIKMAKDFQTSMAHLTNDAGESTKALAMVSSEVLKMAGDVGVAPLKLADALYFVESAGYHGAAALNVLRVSAIAAKVSGADMTAVADITTSALNAYGMAADKAAHVTDVMLQAVSEGKMRFQDLAVAMPTVLPTAAALHISLDEVGAAIATMTMQGDQAADATTHLRMLMLMLVAPTSMATKALKDMGLNADEATKHNLAASLGLKSIHLSASELSASMTAGGPNALLNTLKLLNDRLNLAFPNANDPRREAILKSILSLKGMQAALELTGVHLAQFSGNEKGMADASKGVGKTMAGWADIQAQLNTKLDQFKGKIDAFMISLGNALLPLATSAVGFLSRAFDALVQSLSGPSGATKNLDDVGGKIQQAAVAAGSPSKADSLAANIANITSGLKSFMDSKSTKDFLQFWKDVGNAIQNVANTLDWLDKNIGKPLNDLLSAVNNAGLSTHKFLGDALAVIAAGNAAHGRANSGRASGGPVMPGGIYTVGEQGPETLVMGSRGGTIIPHGAAMAGAAGTVHLTVHGFVGNEQQLFRVFREGIRRLDRAQT